MTGVFLPAFFEDFGHEFTGYTYNTEGKLYKIQFNRVALSDSDILETTKRLNHELENKAHTAKDIRKIEMQLAYLKRPGPHDIVNYTPVESSTIVQLEVEMAKLAKAREQLQNDVNTYLQLKNDGVQLSDDPSTPEEITMYKLHDELKNVDPKLLSHGKPIDARLGELRTILKERGESVPYRKVDCVGKCADLKMEFYLLYYKKRNTAQRQKKTKLVPTNIEGLYPSTSSQSSSSNDHPGAFEIYFERSTPIQ